MECENYAEPRSLHQSRSMLCTKKQQQKNKTNEKKNNKKLQLPQFSNVSE